MIVLNKIKNKLHVMRGKEAVATICYFSSNIFSKAFGFITIPLYTNLLTTSEYGYLNNYNAWVNVLSVVLGLSLSSAIFGKADLKKEKRYELQSSLITLSLISASVISTFIVGVYVLIYGKIDVIVILAIIQGYAMFVVNFILQEWVLDNKYIKYSIVSMLTVSVPVLITCFIINIAFNSCKYLSVIIPRSGVFVLLMICILLYVVARGRRLIDFKIWNWSLRYSIPLVFHTLSITLLLQADRIMLSSLYGYAEAGKYSFIYNVTLVIGVLIGALENTWKTWFFSNYENIDAFYIRKKASIYIYICIFGVFVYILVAPEFVKILANEMYSQNIVLVVPIAFAYIISFLYDFLAYVEYKKQATKQIAMASMIAAISNIILNLMIIPRFGGMGAAFTTVASYLIQFIIHLIVVNKLDKGLYGFKFFILFLCISLIGSVLIATVIDIILIRFIFVVVLVVLFILYLRVNQEYLV